MTSEILIMNRLALAIAADSAVTLGEGEKIFQISNKLFMLSNRHPIGIMFYGNSSLLEVPWETLVKLYRDQLQDTEKATVSEYMVDFLAFLKQHLDFFPLDFQKQFFKNSIYIVFHALETGLHEKFEETENLEEKEMESIIHEYCQEMLKKAESVELLESLDAANFAKLQTSFDAELTEITTEIFEDLPISATDRETFKKIAMRFFCGSIDEIIYPSAGIVMAGFGQKQLFPAFIECEIRSILNNQVLYDTRTEDQISHQNGAIIETFAQKETVNTFLQGVNDEYREWVDSSIQTMLTDYTEALMNQVAPSSSQKRDALLSSTEQFRELLLQRYRDNEEKEVQQHWGPIIDIVSTLPKDELAIMAETLINLTSFKRRVSKDPETVGGPVDVAVISKSDGFVWIKRKRYFNADLNPHAIKRE